MNKEQQKQELIDKLRRALKSGKLDVELTNDEMELLLECGNPELLNAYALAMMKPRADAE